MKKIFLSLLAVILSITLLMNFVSCQQPSSSDPENPSIPEYTGTDFETLNLKYNYVYYFYNNNSKFYQSISKYDSNFDRAIEFEVFDYETFDITYETKPRGTLKSEKYKYNSELDQAEKVSETEEIVEDTYLCYKSYSLLGESRTNDYIYYERFSDSDLEHLNPIELCAFNPNENGKVLYYETRDYTTSGKLSFDEIVPGEKKLYYPDNLTASFNEPAGTINVTGDKKLKEEEYSTFYNGKIIRKYERDFYYDENGEESDRNACIHEYIWNDKNSDIYFYEEECDFDSSLDDYLTLDDDAIENGKIGYANMFTQIQIQNVNDNIEVTKSYMSADLWTQRQIIETRDVFTTEDSKSIDYVATYVVIDQDKNIDTLVTKHFGYENDYSKEPIDKENGIWEQKLYLEETCKTSDTASSGDVDEIYQGQDFTRM